MAMRRVGLLHPKTTTFFLCDIQERFSSLIRHWPSVVHVANLMLDFSETMNIPVIATEQYPRAFGRLVKELHGIPSASDDANGRRVSDCKRIAVFEKTKFSMLDDTVRAYFDDLQTSKADSSLSSEGPSVVLFGIEAHVCVQQTALELISMGCDVHIVADGTSSQNESDRRFAFERLRQCGAYITTYESVLFQLLGDAKHPNFKEVQPIFKTPRVDNGLIAELH